MAKVISEVNESINVKLMKEGEVGVTTKWCGLKQYVGLVVKRIGDKVFSIGLDQYYWSDTNNLTDCEVRLLNKGTIIEL